MCASQHSDRCFPQTPAVTARAIIHAFIPYSFTRTLCTSRLAVGKLMKIWTSVDSSALNASSVRCLVPLPPSPWPT